MLPGHITHWEPLKGHYMLLGGMAASLMCFVKFIFFFKHCEFSAKVRIHATLS